jgi:predicted ATP-grasp superfamily ATP-dependent carboligase
VKPSFEMSSDVEKCCAYLESRDCATYAEISSHLGRRVNGRDRYILESARRHLEKHGIIFVTERGIGLVRANSEQLAKLSTTNPINKIRRATRRAEKRQAHVNVQELTEDERLAFYVGRAVINTIGKNTLKSFRTQIKKEIEKSGGEMITVSQISALRRHRKG